MFNHSFSFHHHSTSPWLSLTVVLGWWGSRISYLWLSTQWVHIRKAEWVFNRNWEQDLVTVALSHGIGIRHVTCKVKYNSALYSSTLYLMRVLLIYKQRTETHNRKGRRGQQCNLVIKKETWVRNSSYQCPRRFYLFIFVVSVNRKLKVKVGWDKSIVWCVLSCVIHAKQVIIISLHR